MALAPAEANESSSENKTEASSISPTKRTPPVPPPTEFHDNACAPNNMGCPPNAHPNYSGEIPQATGADYGIPSSYSQTTSINCIRGFIICMILIIIAFFTAIFITWLVIRPELPVFKVEALSVSNFSTADSFLVSNFDVNFSMENPNRRLKTHFEDFQQAMYHKDDIISTSYGTPVDLDPKQRKVVNLKLSTNTENHGSVGMSVVDDIKRERRSGEVNFNMRAVMTGSFQSGSSWTRTADMRVVCENLKVYFAGNSSEGTFYNYGSACFVSL